MVVDSVLCNAKMYLNGEIVDGCIAIEEGKILKLGKEAHMPKADEQINLHNNLALPGVIDSHVHLRDEANAYKETFISGTAAAAAGGITTVLDMPNNSPVTMSSGSLQNRMKLAEGRVIVNVGFYSEFPLNLAESKAIVEQGALGFKLFMGQQVGGLEIDEDDSIEEAFNQASVLGIPVAVHAEDHLMLQKATNILKLSNKDRLKDFLEAHSEEVEFAAVTRAINISSKYPNSHLHICHVSTKKAIDAIADAKNEGQKVSCEVTPHHLLLTKDMYDLLGKPALTLPPLRTRENVDALWSGVDKGIVDIIGSDHAPHQLQEKDAASIWDVKVGIPGLETTLPLLLTLVHQNKLSLARAIELTSEMPSKIFQLSDRGSISQGKNADLVVVDFNQRFIIDASKFKSKAKFSPFDKRDVRGKPLKTFVNGKLIMDEGEIVAKPGIGNIVRRKMA